MILNCPSCETRFAVPDRLIGPTGRRVKCAACKNIWHQNLTPSDDEDFSDILAGIETIPEGVKPIPEGSNLPVTTNGLPFSIFGTIAATIIMICLFFGLSVPFKEKIVSLWQPTAAIYETAGFHMPVLGEGLNLERIKVVEAEGTSPEVRLSGYVTNTESIPMPMPDIKMSLIRNNEIIVSENYKTIFPVIPGGQSNRFKTSFNIEGQDFSQALVTFTPSHAAQSSQ